MHFQKSCRSTYVLLITVHYNLPEPLSILNEDREIPPSNSVINAFSRLDSVTLNILCLGTLDNQNLQWESRNVSSLNDGEITVADSNRNIALEISSLYRRFLMLSINPFQSQFFGYYLCRSRQSNNIVEVYVTTENPLWQVISPPNNFVPMGFVVTLTVRYGDNSVGYQNNGTGFVYSLVFLPCAPAQPSNVLLTGISGEFNNQLQYTFRARLNDDSGEFLWNCTYVHLMLRTTV